MLRDPEYLYVLDTNRQGDFLATENNSQYGVMTLAPGTTTERDLSWLDSSDEAQISADGQWLLLSDSDPVAGPNYALLLRKTDGSPAVRLGDGTAMGISPDGAWALSIVPGPPMQLVLYPTGAGEKRVLDRGNIQNYQSAKFFPDGKRVLACGSEPGRATRCYAQDITGGAPRPVTPEGTTGGFVSPDGKNILVQGAKGKYFIYPVGGGLAQAVSGLAPQDIIIRWNGDGRSVLVFRTSEVPARAESVDLSTGRRTLVRELAPADLAGVRQIQGVSFASGRKSYAYAYDRDLSRLTIIKGVK